MGEGDSEPKDMDCWKGKETDSSLKPQGKNQHYLLVP